MEEMESVDTDSYDVEMDSYDGIEDDIGIIAEFESMVHGQIVIPVTKDLDSRTFLVYNVEDECDT